MKNKTRVILQTQEDSTDWLRYLATAIAVLLLTSMAI